MTRALKDWLTTLKKLMENIYWYNYWEGYYEDGSRDLECQEKSRMLKINYSEPHPTFDVGFLFVLLGILRKHCENLPNYF